MEGAWRAPAVEQDWLDGEIVQSAAGHAEPRDPYEFDLSKAENSLR
jgi:hypothetical protein